MSPGPLEGDLESLAVWNKYMPPLMATVMEDEK